jgi:excisionase family DNA binding protein
MRNQERHTVDPSDDSYLSLKALAKYSGLSVRTLRGYITHPAHPLPCYRIGGRVLVRRSDFDAWASHFRVVRSSSGLDELVNSVIGRLR